MKSFFANSSLNETSFAMFDNHLNTVPASTDAELFDAYLEEETEDPLELEEWMLNEKLFISTEEGRNFLDKLEGSWIELVGAVGKVKINRA